jgi:hypothetical protein
MGPSKTAPGAPHRDLAVAPLISWVSRTPNRTFVLYPLLVGLDQIRMHGGWRRPRLRFTPILLWGYLQYRLVGRYRSGQGGGGPGITIPPDVLVEDGPYAMVRNPMYLGHLIFLSGLALTFRSRLAGVLLLVNAVWFHRRVLEDEARLGRRFGPAYARYRTRVKRWIPGLL